MEVLIDTSVFVAVERGHLDLQQLLIADNRYAISVVSAAELLHGIHRATGKRAQIRAAYVEGLLASFEPVPIDLLVARAYARTSAELAVGGIRINPNDLWIGATAIVKGFALLALDGDFALIPGVRLLPTPQTYP